MLQIGGRGIFTWHSGLLPWYYRLGGAKIGKGVVIHPKAVMTDLDLITIGKGACVDAALVSPNQIQTLIFQILPAETDHSTRI